MVFLEIVFLQRQTQECHFKESNSSLWMQGSYLAVCKWLMDEFVAIRYFYIQTSENLSSTSVMDTYLWQS